MIPAKLFNRKYRAFTDEGRPVQTVTRSYTSHGILHVESFGGHHPFIRKPKPILAEYQRLGYPYRKTLRGLKRFVREQAEGE